MREERDYRRFKFYEEDEYGFETELSFTVPDSDVGEDEMEYMLEQFKRFLRGIGYNDINISQLQYLENEEWKYVLSQYGDWDDEKEKLYQWFNRN